MTWNDSPPRTRRKNQILTDRCGPPPAAPAASWRFLLSDWCQWLQYRTRGAREDKPAAEASGCGRRHQRGRPAERSRLGSRGCCCPRRWPECCDYISWKARHVRPLTRYLQIMIKSCFLAHCKLKFARHTWIPSQVWNITFCESCRRAGLCYSWWPLACSAWPWQHQRVAQWSGQAGYHCGRQPEICATGAKSLQPPIQPRLGGLELAALATFQHWSYSCCLHLILQVTVSANEWRWLWSGCAVNVHGLCQHSIVSQN